MAGITQLALPDQQLVDASKAGFAYTQIDRSGNALDTGTNGYHAEYEHDVIGILANMFSEGYFTDAHALLDETDQVVGTNTQYSDGAWVYPWLWALYVEKTGDTKFLAQRFGSPGPQGASAQPSIQATAQIIAADRTGPGGIIGETNDIDANGYWVSDNYEALLGLACYEYLAKVMGNTAQAQWADGEYNSLLQAVNSTLSSTISTNNLNYISLLDGSARHRQPLLQPGGRQLGRARRLLQLGLERVHARRSDDQPGRRNGRGLDRQDPVLRFRPGEGPAAGQHVRRIPGRGLLADRLQRRVRSLGAGQQQLPRRGRPLAGVPHQQRPGRAVLLVGGLHPAGTDAVGRESPGQLRRLVPALMGHCHG